MKTCAEVSKLLGFKTPAARALAYCAAQAFKAKDTSTGHRYIQQLIKTAKGFADIYHVCKDVIPLCEEPSVGGGYQKLNNFVFSYGWTSSLA